MKQKIIVLGSSNTDLVVKSPKFPLPGETVIGDGFLMNHGGKGANQAVAASRLGGDVTFVGCIGDDDLGRRAISALKNDKIDVSHVKISKGDASGVALITVDAKGENTIIVAAGANMKLTPEDVRKTEPMNGENYILLMQLETPIPTVAEAASLAARKGAKVILNPAPATELPAELYKNLSILIPNEREASLLSGVTVTDETSAVEAAKVLCEKGVEIVIITLGSKGALIYDGENTQAVPAVKVVPVDTTAAGDTFCGALCVALSEQKPLAEAVAFANRCAAVTVTRMGSQNSIPFINEIK